MVLSMVPASEWFANLIPNLQQSLSAEWFGIALWQYVFALILLIGSSFAQRFAARLLDHFVLPIVNRYGGEYPRRVISALIRPTTAFVGLLGIYLAVRVLLLPRGDEPVLVSPSWIDRSFEVAVATIAVWVVVRFVDILALHLQGRAEENNLPVDVPVIPLLRKSLKVFVAVVGGLLVIQHTGYPITSLLGGLGIGGLAVALAAQDTLANVFGSVIVFTDKPFKVGDWIAIGDMDGFVETIGFRSTRIRTWPKALVTIPNKVIANSQITNWSAMPVRRVSFRLRVAYGAKPDTIETFVEGIRDILRHHPGVDQGYHLVSFENFGIDGFEILIYYFSSSTVWKEHMTVRQEVNLEIMRLMDRLGLQIAVPARSLRFPQSDDDPSPDFLGREPGSDSDAQSDLDTDPRHAPTPRSGEERSPG